MSTLFTAYGPSAVAAVICLVASVVEARAPLAHVGGRFVVRYPMSLAIMCIILLIFCAAWALALAAVERDSALSRLAIWSMVGLPAILLAFEVLGRRITVDATTIRRTYFGFTVFERPRQDLVAVMYDTAWKAYKLAFSSGGFLRVPTMMQGSHESRSDCIDETPNHAMERTADRCAFTFEMTSTLPLRATRALVRRRSSCSR